MKAFMQSSIMFLLGAIIGFIGLTHYINNKDYVYIIYFGAALSAIGLLGLIYSTRKEQPKKKKGGAL